MIKILKKVPEIHMHYTLSVPRQPSLSSPPTFSVPRQPSLSSPPTFSQFPANLPSDRLWLRVSYSPGWQVISPPPPLGDQEGCSMEGKGQPPPAAWPHHPTPQLPGARRGGWSAAAATTVIQPSPISQSSQQHTPPPATIYCTRRSVHVW